MAKVHFRSHRIILPSTMEAFRLMKRTKNLFSAFGPLDIRKQFHAASRLSAKTILDALLLMTPTSKVEKTKAAREQLCKLFSHPLRNILG